MQGAIERLSTQDMSFLEFEDRNTPMHVAAVTVFEAGPLRTADGGIDVQRIAKYLDARLDALPRYRRRLTTTLGSGRPAWLDDPAFDIGYHVRHAAIPRPGDDRALKQVVGRILSHRLDRSRPLWELWVLEGLSDDRFAILMKIHHSMVDGASGMQLAGLLYSLDPFETQATGSSWRPEPAPNAATILWDEFKATAELPLAALRGLRDAVNDPLGTAQEVVRTVGAVGQAIGGAVSRISETPLNQPLSSHRRMDWLALPLDEVQRARKHLNASMNDFALAIVAGGLRRFLAERGVALDGLDYRVCLPVDVRPPGDDFAQANHVSAIFASLPLDERDPIRQLRRIQEQTDHQKGSDAALGTDLLVRLGDLAPSRLLTRLGVGLANRVPTHNLIVTNVKGPEVPLYMLGARLLSMIPAVPLFENQDLGVAIASYDGTLYLGLSADWERLPDLSELTEALERAMDELVEASPL